MLCWLRLRVSSMFIDVCNTDISEALPDAEGKRRSKADAWAEGNSKSKAKTEAVCSGKIVDISQGSRQSQHEGRGRSKGKG